jgi:signal transduction histidine kinase
MQERVLALGVKLTITAKVPSGVRIWAWLPSAIKNQERGSP